MKDDKKKPIFEPVSAEEAKRIRAFGRKRDVFSGVDCPDFIHEPCFGKYDGAPCCFHSGANDIYGVCVRDESGSLIYTLRCATDPSQFPPDWPDFPDHDKLKL